MIGGQLTRNSLWLIFIQLCNSGTHNS